MPKNIVLLSDGTGNSAAKLFKTNVWRLYQALDLSHPGQQVAFYNDGVGTSSFKPLAILGGAFGWGLKRNVIDIYTFLCRNYEPDDSIYCFGFSRGAFTARVLAGLIHEEGLVHAAGEIELRRLAEAAYRHLRSEHFHSKLRLEAVGRKVRDMFSSISPKEYRKRRDGQHRPGIHFIGLWDTVAAYGLPIDELTRAWNWVFPLSVPDREPLPNVRICHAVAIDDERNTFHPVLFNEDHLPGRNLKTTNINDERVTQVWFTGMHSNVGGGYPDDGLSYLTLKWMMEQAGALRDRPGLFLNPVDRSVARSSAVALGKLYDSRRGLGGFYRYLPRKMHDLTNDTVNKKDQVVVPRPKIHESVIERIRQGTDHYAPIVLPSHYAVVRENGDIVDQAEALEDQSQSQSRANLQEKIWNRVWWKRLAYFSSIAVFLLLVAFPLKFGATEVCVGRFCFFSPVIGWIGAFLPAFASTWLEAYRSHPFWFLVLAALFGAFLWIGDRIQGKICDSMNAIWKPIRVHPRSAVTVEPLPNDFLFRYRTNPAYLWFVKTMKRFVLPLLVGLAAAVALAETAARLSFVVMSSAAWVCSDSAATHTDRFFTNSPCWKSPYWMYKGRRYRITIDIGTKNDWYDSTIPATLRGLRGENLTLPMYSAVLLRRVLTEPWFKPIGRIGPEGNDLYPLDTKDGSKPDESVTKMISEITARRDGAFYLYVNDAVLPAPNSWQWFYQNNHGSAKVTVDEIKENE